MCNAAYDALHVDQFITPPNSPEEDMVEELQRIIIEDKDVALHLPAMALDMDDDKQGHLAHAMLQTTASELSNILMHPGASVFSEQETTVDSLMRVVQQKVWARFTIYLLLVL